MIRFAVMSDIHVQDWDLESQDRLISALHDYGSLPQPPSVIVINGDLTEGHDEDYSTLLRLLVAHAPCPVYVTIGNHEYYRMWYQQSPSRKWSMDTFPNGWSSRQALKLFLDRFQLHAPYYDKWLHGYHFIFLGGECYRDDAEGMTEHAWLSDDQLAFLRQKLQGNSGESEAGSRKPVFVFLHQPLEEVVQRERLERLLAAHPEVILFAGHTHHQLLSRGTYLAGQGGFARLNSSSIRRPWSELDVPLSGSISESLLVEVRDGEVRMKGRRHDKRAWLAQASFIQSAAP